MQVIHNSFFEWMVADPDEYTYSKENIQEIEKQHGLTVKSWECWWDPAVGSMYSYYAYILWKAEDGRCGYDRVYHYHYPHDSRDETSIDNYGPFELGEWNKMCEDIRKEMDAQREEQREHEKRQKETAKILREYYHKNR